MDAPEPKPVDVPQQPPPRREADAFDSVHLEVRVDELESRLRARSIELETELKSKERLRERVRELTTRVEELQATASALHREAASSTSLARELDETLKVAAEARAQLGAALEAERSRRVALEADLSVVETSLNARVGELEADGKRLTEERATLQTRAVAAEDAGARAEAELSRVRDEARATAAKFELSAAEARRRDEELTAARRNLSQLRQKTVGHEAHIDSLRADLEQARAARAESADVVSGVRGELLASVSRVERVESELIIARAELAKAAAERDGIVASTAEMRADFDGMRTRAQKADVELLAARARMEEVSRTLSSAQSALEQSRLLTRRSEDEGRRLQAVIHGLEKTFDDRTRAEEMKSRLALEAAELVRREGVEAFEKAHESSLHIDLEAERMQKELAEGMRRIAAESEQLKHKAAKLKEELRARSDREIAEMRHALDEERARLYADLEVERESRGRRAASAAQDEGVADLNREQGEARRREIARELEGYLTPPAKPSPAEPVPVVTETATPRAVADELAQPAGRPRFQWDEELRLLLYVATSVAIVAVVVAGFLLYQG